MRVGGQRHAPAALTPGKIPSNHCIGGWVNQRVGLEGCRKYCSHWHSFPAPSSPWQVATPTTISGPLYRAMRRRIQETRSIIIIIIIIIIRHGFGRLNCSGIDALPSFPGASAIQGCASLLLITLFSLGGLPTHPQNPHSGRTSLSLLVWPLFYGLSGLGGPTRNIKFPSPPHPQHGGDNRGTEINLLFVFGHSQNPGAWSPGHLKLISVAPNIFSIITAVLILPYKKCVSSEAPSTTREITDTFTGHSRIVWVIMESVLWHPSGALTTEVAPILLGKVVEPCFMGKQNTVNADTPRKKSLNQ